MPSDSRLRRAGKEALEKVALTDPVLYYQTCGDPLHPPVVFLHGFMGDSEDWEAVVSHLSGKYYCVMVDLPGHGRSLGEADKKEQPGFYSMAGAAEGVLRVMRHQCLKPATVVGYSMGGRIALYLASRHRTACSRLVIESATPGIRDREGRQTRLRLDSARAQQLQAEGLPDFLRSWYRQPIFETIAESPSRLEAIIRKRSRNDPSKLAAVLTGMSAGRQKPLWDQLPGLNIPVLLLAGERDAKYVGIARAMSVSLPRATVGVVPDCGHTIHLEDPGAVARRIDDFIRQGCMPPRGLGRAT